MLYLNVLISLLIVSAYLVVKLPKLNKLSPIDSGHTIDRWALHFSIELFNQILGASILIFASAELAHQLFRFQQASQ